MADCIKSWRLVIDVPEVVTGREILSHLHAEHTGGEADILHVLISYYWTPIRPALQATITGFAQMVGRQASRAHRRQELAAEFLAVIDMLIKGRLAPYSGQFITVAPVE